MKKKKRFFQYQRTSKSVFLIFLLLCTAVGTASFQYYTKLQATIQEESSSYLQEISKRTGSNINRIINDNYAVLETLASLINHTIVNIFEDIDPTLQLQKKYWNYQDILLIDRNDTAYNSAGEQVSLNSDIYLREAVINKKNAMSPSQLINNQERILLAIPLNDVEVNGKSMAALAASYSPETFDQLLSMSSFNGQAYAHIIDKDGNMIVRSTSPAAPKTGYNVLNSLKDENLSSNIDFDKIKLDIANDQHGQVSVTLNGVPSYMVYTPIDPEDWYLLTFVPVSVVNQKSDMLLRTTLLICGLITLLFAGLISFILYTFYRHKTKLENIAYVDSITGGHTAERFYELTQEALAAPGRPQYALVYSNIVKFKVLNAQFGRQTCDHILKVFNEFVSSSLHEKECIGRLSADNFCILLEYKDEKTLLQRFNRWHRLAEKAIQEMNVPWGLPLTEFGVYVIDNDTIPFPLMVDRAKLALQKLPRAVNSKLRYAVYDDEVRRKLFREKQLEDMMENALKEHEFQVYLQPKYHVSDEKIGGAEALSRWNSVSEGMIFPDEFIPLFEKNGFIIQLDLWVFEQVCILLRKWLDEGKTAIPISVNCSRVHLKDPHFLVKYKEISARYNIPGGLLEIELTESVVMEDAGRLAGIIETIRDAGFCCSMDDFGSGYSSLNLIRDIPVDTLKLDRVFFLNNEHAPQRTRSVVGSIIRMAKELNMSTVAEGVELPEQIQMLRELECDYIQSYFYAKPMPVSDFETLAFNK